jgi:sialate O-acetylesterase
MRRWMLTVMIAMSVAMADVRADALELAPVFQNSMVLQQNVPLPVWGTASPGAQVSVSFAGKLQTTHADSNGQWSVRLDAVPASASPRDLEVTSSTTVRLHDVLVGEVWLAAGQSNMEFPLSRELHAATEIPKAGNPDIRLLNMSFAGQYVYGTRFSPAILDRLTLERFYDGSWKQCTPASARSFSAIAYYFARDLQRSLNVPIGVTNMAVGGSPIQAWIRRGAMADDPQLQSIVRGNWLTSPPVDDWCKQRGRENLGSTPVSADPSGPNHPFKPGFLWEAGVSRLIPFPVRGVIWYQGESNSLDKPSMLQHEALFRTLVADWRKQWGIGEFPFLYCQLSGIGTAHYKSEFWPEFRDQQRRLLSELPDMAMAVTSDYGNKNDVHPREKREIGSRLCAAALAIGYGRKEKCEGLLPDSLTSSGAELIVGFAQPVDGLRTSDEQPPRDFDIAGPDGHFYPAEAAIDGKRLQLRSPQVTNPVSARYDWQPFPDGNVINSAGFPCSTFEMSVSGSAHAH